MPKKSQEPLTAAQEAALDYARTMGPQTRYELPRMGMFETGEKQREALHNIAALRELRSAVEEQIRVEVAAARKNTRQEYWPNNASWIEIGAALGVTKQSAQSRYGK